MSRKNHTYKPGNAEDRIKEAVAKVKARQGRRDQKELDRMARMQEAAGRKLHEGNRADLERLKTTKNMRERIQLIRGVEDRNQEATGEERTIAQSATRDAVDYVTQADYKWKPAARSGASIASEGLSNVTRDAGRVIGYSGDPRIVLVGNVRRGSTPQARQSPLPGLDDPMFFMNRSFVGGENRTKRTGDNLGSYAHRLLGR